MKRIAILILGLVILAGSCTLQAETDCLSGGCVPPTWTDSDIIRQDQMNSIANTNVAQSVNQFQLQSPVLEIPTTTIGKDFSTCANPFWYTGVGGSKARLSGVNNNVFGNGSWAVGANAGYVHPVGTEDCLKDQFNRRKKFEIETMFGTNMGCLTLVYQLEERVLDARPVLYSNPDIKKQCQVFIDSFYSQRKYAPKKETIERIIQEKIEYKEPEFEKVLVGYNQYRLHVGDFGGCQTCGGISYHQVRKDLMSKGVKREHIYIKDFKTEKGVIYSVNIVRDDFMTETNALIASQEYYVMGISGLQVKPLLSSARYEYRPRKKID